MNRRAFLATIPALAALGPIVQAGTRGAVVSAAQRGNREAFDEQAVPPACAKNHERMERHHPKPGEGRGWAVCRACGAAYDGVRWLRPRRLTHPGTGA